MLEVSVVLGVCVLREVFSLRQVFRVDRAGRLIRLVTVACVVCVMHDGRKAACV